MRPNSVVVATPPLDDHLRFASASKVLRVEAFITKLPVEAFIGAVLPGFTGVDERSADTGLHCPFQDRLGNKLGTVVRTKKRGHTVKAHKLREDLYDTRRANATGDIDSETLPRPFIHHREALELPAVRASVENEVVGPYVIRTPGLGWARSMRGHPATRTLPWHLQACTAPQAMHSFVAHGVTIPSEKDADSPVAVARVLSREFAHLFDGGGILDLTFGHVLNR